MSAPKKRSLGDTATLGVAWMMAQSLSMRSLGLLSQFVLTWLLSPADFGAVGLASTVAALSNTVMNLGIDEVLLQRQHALRRWAPAAFWMTIVFALTTMGLIVIAAPTIARWYGTPELTGLLDVQAAAMPIWALSTVPYVQARAQLKFKLQAIYNTSELAASQVMTILLAWAGFGAYSFVLPLPVLAVVKAAVFWRQSPIAVAGGMQAFRLIYLAVSGLTVFGTRVLNELIQQGGYIVLGLTANNTMVGLYYFAFRLAVQPVRIMAVNSHTVLLPTFSQFRSDPQRQSDSALRAARVLSAVVMPLCFLQAALSDPVLRLVASAQWVHSIILVQILSLGLPFDAVSWLANALLNARGQFARSAVYTGVSVMLLLGMVFAGARLGSAVGVAAAVSLYYVVQGPTYSKLVFGRAISWRGLVADLYGLPAAVAAVSMGLAYALSLAPVLNGWQIPRAMVIGVAGVGLHGLIYWKLQPEMSREVFRRLGGERAWRLAARRWSRA